MEKNKLEEWRKKLKQLEEIELPKALARIGESVSTGDWHENAEYEDANLQVEIIQNRIKHITQLIKQLEKQK